MPAASVAAAYSALPILIVLPAANAASSRVAAVVTALPSSVRL